VLFSSHKKPSDTFEGGDLFPRQPISPGTQNESVLGIGTQTCRCSQQPLTRNVAMFFLTRVLYAATPHTVPSLLHNRT